MITIQFVIDYTDTSRTGPTLDFPISEPKSTIVIGTAEVPDICLTRALYIGYSQPIDGQPNTGSEFFPLPLYQLGDDRNLYSYHVGGSDVDFHWPTNLTAYDVCGVLHGTTLTITAKKDGVKWMVPISNGTTTFPNLAYSLPSWVYLRVDSLNITLIGFYMYPTG
ncbi:uncharacterized protein LOC108674269 [Hyalella azteca]|uniref:Uncharacterized protein LOC108674269 n=1 Tax=Hyalella azteca TaxID=294128 RepID=A0A8B7NVE1_HYAAZ|nr:uncharacterized protein LOC108674269 [Hyalella azteca]